jgi:hypothetical protein
MTHNLNDEEKFLRILNCKLGDDLVMDGRELAVKGIRTRKGKIIMRKDGWFLRILKSNSIERVKLSSLSSLSKLGPANFTNTFIHGVSLAEIYSLLDKGNRTIISLVDVMDENKKLFDRKAYMDSFSDDGDDDDVTYREEINNTE